MSDRVFGMGERRILTTIRQWFVLKALLLTLAPCLALAGGEATLGVQLSTAAGSGEVDAVKSLLYKGVDINGMDLNGRTAVMEAAEAGRLEVVKLLIERGANVNLRSRYRRTALMDAARKGHLNVASMLLERGADVNAKGLAWWDVQEIIRARTRDEAKQLLADARDSTALIEAVASGHLEIARLLIESGAYVNAETESGETALTRAIWMSSTKDSDMVKLLLSKGADVRGNRRIPPLRVAVRKGREDLVTVLLDRGADPCNDEISLWLCVYGGEVDILRLLLDRGANANSKDENGRTLLMEAAARDHQLKRWYHRLKDLLVRIVFLNPWGPVYRSGERDPQMVKLLLDKGADVNARDQEGWTALNRAQRRGSKEIVELLKAYGANE